MMVAFVDGDCVMWQKVYDKAVSQVQGGVLYVVATPIGNLADISLHALAVLSRADCVCAEDTRVSRQLLASYGLSARFVSVREHNEQEMAARVVAALAAGEVVVQVSDAGTPAVCDPGARLVNAVREAGFRVVPVVGASAVMGALSVAGVVSPEFYFAGFLPAKSAERKRCLAAWTDVSYAVVAFETPHRIEATLADMTAVLGERTVVLAREISKAFETFLSGRPAALQVALREDANQARGEMVLVLHPADKVRDVGLSADALRVMKALAPHLPKKTVAALTAELTGANKKAVYEALL